MTATGAIDTIAGDATVRAATADDNHSISLVLARAFAEDPVFIDAAGAALWAPPGGQAVADEHGEEFAGRIATVVGSAADRVFAAVELLEQYHPDTDCYYLNFLGVHPARHGVGLGSALLSATLRYCDDEGQPAHLEATSPRNRRLYQRHGFATTGEIILPDGPSLWPMWREPRAMRGR